MRERLTLWGKWLAGPVAVALVLGLIGPFGTYALLPLGPRLGYWLAVVALNWVLCDIAVRAVERAMPDGIVLRRMAVPLAGAFAASVPATGVVTLANGLSGIGWPDAVLTLYGQVLLLLAAITLPVYTLVDLQETLRNAAPSEPEAMPRNGLALFQARLPRPLDGQLLCLEMQDHYLKVHTSAGSAMILCRMEDAARELGPLGQRVHRSWWVADAARDRVERAGQRLTIRLCNGAQVPVGRTYRPALKAAGWI
ncbi:MAG: LytTR family transcriptional regulator DNA-binding domain-containing protein [Rhodobacteraceae bacterium]|nr:LytTR family transcriptional regulator DNA-binding domain-containing protein [Paracoccaceae bacterium]